MPVGWPGPGALFVAPQSDLALECALLTTVDARLQSPSSLLPLQYSCIFSRLKLLLQAYQQCRYDRPALALPPSPLSPLPSPLSHLPSPTAPMSPSTKEELDSALATAASGDFSLGKGFLNAADDIDTLSQCLPDLHDPKTTHLYYTKGTYDMHEEGKLLAAKLLWENTWSKLDVSGWT